MKQMDSKAYPYRKPFSASYHVIPRTSPDDFEKHHSGNG
jgi:hypothetical protein